MNNDENNVQSLPTPTPSPAPQLPPPSNDVKLVNIAIVDENTALNVMVSFLTLAHKRGSFSIDESAKIWECIKIFQKPI
jgi:hypothetical protein